MISLIVAIRRYLRGLTTRPAPGDQPMSLRDWADLPIHHPCAE